jgi:hypothetical protein
MVEGVTHFRNETIAGVVDYNLLHAGNIALPDHLGGTDWEDALRGQETIL